VTISVDFALEGEKALEERRGRVEEAVKEVKLIYKEN